MNRQPLIGLAAFIFVISSCAASKKALHTLRSDIEKQLSGKKGTFAVAFKDLKTGKQLKINEEVVYHAASTMKTPVLIEVYKQAAEGKLSLTDSIELKNEFRSIVDGSSYNLDPSDDSEFDLYKHIGEKRSIDSLVYQMIIVSSNFATNLIIEKVGAQNVTNYMRQLGANDIQVLRGVEDGKAFEKGLNNTTTARDLLLILRRIAERRAVSARASDEMVKVMLGQQFNEGIPAGLPKEVRVSHKTGSITKVNHDAAIVYAPARKPYVLVVLERGIEDEKRAHKLIADVSRVVYEATAAASAKN